MQKKTNQLHTNFLHIKLLIIFSILFSSATYHQNAQAGALKTTRNIIITVAAIAGVYYLTKKFGESENQNDSQDMHNLKRFAKRITFNIDDTGETINNSIKENFGVDAKNGIKKVSGKTTKVIIDTKNAIEQGLDNTFLTPEERLQKVGAKIEKDFKKDPITGLISLIKNGTKFIDNEIKLNQ